MTLPHNSPEVEAEVLEISTALAIELKADLGSYTDCFRNTGEQEWVEDVDGYSDAVCESFTHHAQPRVQTDYFAEEC